MLAEPASRAYTSEGRVAHLIPPDYPQGTPPGEALVFDLLKGRSVKPDWTVLHSLHLPEHVRQVEGEADFFVLMPGLGALCIEVKSHLRASYVNGAWYLGRRGGPDYRGPFRQAEMAARSIKKKVKDALPAAARMLFWPAVIFTHCVPAATSDVGEWHPWQMLTSADLAREPLDHLLERVMLRARDHVANVPTARWFAPASRRPSKAECDQIRRVLRPDVHFLPDISALRARRVEEIRHFTDEQLAVIEGLDGVNERALIEGPAGTGKTVLALEEARKASAAGASTALLCFNQQLAAHLRSEATALGLRGIEIATLHALMLRIVKQAGLRAATPTDDEAYWSRTLPEAALSVLIDHAPRFDFLIVDEAQDLAEPAYLDVLDALLDGELSQGRWTMFGDFEHQAIFATSPAEAIDRLLARSKGVARYRLRRNCRNTPRVAEYIVRLGGLTPAYSRILRPDCGPAGTPHTSFYSSQQEQAELLCGMIKELTAEEEFAASDIVVLSPLVDSCARRVAGKPGRPPLTPLSERREDSSSFSTVSSFKGLEAPVVILTDIDEVSTPRAQRLFYVGLSRATDRLRVLAKDGLQPDVVRLVTGGEPP
ncbi:ATP-binding domain-containing protein [Micromonospora sp. NPDC007271]|uniref:nuclease-related domain-containing DEAD/DEAH box helicase n=1 Tax=Micromonospora sp. NPDC007271 TaxID=3154587 RepID=UPI00340BE84B